MTLGSDASLIVNVIVAILIIGSLVLGYINGFLVQVINIVVIGIIILLGFMLAPGLADLIHVFPKDLTPFANTALADVFYSKINTICWFIIIVAVGSIILLILKPILKAITELPVIKTVDRVVGMVLSLIPCCLIIITMTYMLSTALFTNGKDVVDNSVLKYTSVVTDKITTLVSDTFAENVSLQKLIQDPLSLNQQDIEKIINWLSNANVSSEEIYNFLKEYGIDTNTLNQFFNQGE